MFGRVRDAYLWVRGIQQYRRGDYERARVELDKIRGARKASSEFNAMMATISLLQGDHQNAKRLFEIAVDHTTATRSDYKQYVDHYCRYYLSTLDGNEGAKVKHLEAALRQPAPSIIKQWLPLS